MKALQISVKVQESYAHLEADVAGQHVGVLADGQPLAVTRRRGGRHDAAARARAEGRGVRALLWAVLHRELRKGK